ncbi:MAG: NAD(P)-dependent oxidoreductase [Anaerolineales bacterium]|nr:MAG: NAD(P)-dependent oxidoreductase [Anaerolineales bacterium]
MKKTIGILSPGDMGHGVGGRLVENGVRVIYCSDGRSARTRDLAKAAHIEAVPTYDALVNQADIVLSILVPAAAKGAAVMVAQALTRTHANVLYVDCNAIAPQTVIEIGQIITDAGSAFLDASIIGGPPRGEYTPRIYISGNDTQQLDFLNTHGLNILHLSERAGDASALKMCFAASTKGSTALYLTLMSAARALGVSDALIEEFRMGQRLESMERGVTRVAVKSRRFVGEMEEMDKTFTAVGIHPNMLAGAAEIYRLMGETHLADRVPEDTSPFPSLDETLDIMVAHLEGKTNAD